MTIGFDDLRQGTLVSDYCKSYCDFWSRYVVFEGEGARARAWARGTRARARGHEGDGKGATGFPGSCGSRHV